LVSYTSTKSLATNILKFPRAPHLSKLQKTYLFSESIFTKKKFLPPKFGKKDFSMKKTIYFTSSKITTTENQHLTFLWYKNEDNSDYFLLIISNQKIFYPAS